MKLQHFQEILEYGKSTLINSIFDDNKAQEGSLSEKLQRGKNTTTSIMLYPFKDGYIADTPGFSTFSIEEIQSNELAKYYREFKKYIPKCEYTNCQHIKETNCGIKYAVEKNEISKERYERYKKIMENLIEREAYKKW